MDVVHEQTQLVRNSFFAQPAANVAASMPVSHVQFGHVMPIISHITALASKAALSRL